MPQLYDVRMTAPDGEGYRTIELMAEDKAEASFICEKQARDLAEAEVLASGGSVNDYLFTMDKGYPKEKQV